MDDLLNNAPCGFLTFADDGTILAVNATLLDMLGHDPGGRRLQGEHIGSILSVGGRVFYQTHLFPLLKLQGRVEEIYLSLRSRDGADLPVLVNAVRRERAGAIANECVFVPMRQRERFEDEILQAKRAAEEATRAKDRAYAALAQAHQELELRQAELLELNAKLHARAAREALLNRIGQALRTWKEPEGMRVTTAALGEALGADRCYFAEYELARDWARVGADWHRTDLPPLRGTYRISDFGLDIARAYGPEGLLLAPDIRAAEAALSPRAAEAWGMRSLVGVALFEDGIPVASLNVAMAEAPRAWTEEEVQLVQAVAAFTRSAVEEVRLREREHRIAENLQDALRPAFQDNIPGLKIDAYYRPALDEASIGGDFYDVFPLEPDCYALVVADLSGKGLAAAAQIATVRHMLRALLYQRGITAAQAVAALNEMLIEHELLTGFATLFVGAYDVNRRALTYVNAGQEPGLVRRAVTAAVEEMGPTGPVLGGFPGAAFEERTVSLAPGDVLALFTDGLTEAGPNRKDQLGLPGIAVIFQESGACETPGRPRSPQEIKDRIMQRVEAAVTPAGLRDDVCLLVACVQ